MTSCCLVECKNQVDAATGRVEVRAFQVTAGQQKGFKTSWGEGGDAVFHPDCWRKLRQATTGTSGDITLSETEVKLVKEAAKTAEYHDADDQIKSEARRIAQMLKTSSYCIAFTGAGISTAAGIGDFRGKDGKWTERAKKKEHGAKGMKKGESKGKKLAELRPTYTHEAIAKLLDMGHVKFLISQNTDGLHRLSGIPQAKIAELHGNTFVEKCGKCEARYERTQSWRALKSSQAPPLKCKRCRINHRTGRKCERKGCDGCLMNTIINFGDYLEGEVLDTAEDNAKKADLVLCLGSTLRVTPASDLVEMGKQPIRLVICNRQGTPYDEYCGAKGPSGEPVGSRIYGDCDKLMRCVMAAILDSESLQEWEDGRESRMTQYDKRRQ